MGSLWSAVSEEENLDAFIQRELKPYEECLKQIDQDVNLICDILGSNEHFSVQSMAKGGSYGRETVLRGYSDGTLVFFIDGWEKFQDQKENQHKVLSVFEQQLKNHPKFKGKVMNLGSYLEVQVSTRWQDMSLKLFPAFNPLGSLTLGLNETPSHWVYWNLKSAMDQVKAVPGEFSICFTELQQKFFNKYPRKLKDLILFIKHLYRKVISNLHLLIVYAWEQGCQAEDFDMAVGLKTMLGFIRKQAKLCVYWTVNYNFKNETIRNTLLCQLSSERPIILDPTDPTNNLGQDKHFRQLLAKEVLFPKSSLSPAPCWNVMPAPLFSTPNHLLDKFIKDFLQPSKKFLDQISKAVKIIHNFLEENHFQQSSTKVLKVVKGGSTAKGTALKDGSDVDIIVFLSSLNSYESQKTKRSQIIEEIQKQLEACQQTRDFEVKFEISKWKAPRVLSFTLKSKSLNESIDFDVLPAHDALGQLSSKFTVTPKTYMDLIELYNSQDILGGEFSTCFTELQWNFIKTRTTKLKDLIRLVKHWHKQCERKIKPKASLPPKYALELLTVYAWEQGSGVSDFDIAEGFRAILDLVTKYQQLCIFWTINYNFKDEPVRTFLLTQIQKTRPVILDPADPTGDVGGGDRWCWHLLAKEAKEWLSSPCFEVDCRGSRGIAQPWKEMQTPGSCGAGICPTVSGV
uniref:2'-5' oligoadenylate synthase n=1 Tax=Nannospalax galili TaxID=1026970 RepID=A0A8C6QB54_NANGA